MSYSQKVYWETLRSIDSAGFTGTYTAIGTPLLHPGYIVIMVNNSTVLVTVSIDGVTDVDVCPAGSFWLYDESKEGPDKSPSLPPGTQIYVKGVAGSGLVYLVSQYVASS